MSYVYLCVFRSSLQAALSASSADGRHTIIMLRSLPHSYLQQQHLRLASATYFRSSIVLARLVLGVLCTLHLISTKHVNYKDSA